MHTIPRGMIMNIKTYWSSKSPFGPRSNPNAVKDIETLCQYIAEQDVKIRDLTTEVDQLKKGH